MGELYDRAEIYDLANSEEKNEIVKKHYQKLLEGRNLHTILDCSIGSGNLTLGPTELGNTDVETRLFPYVCELPYEKMEWYCLIATKSEAGG